MESYRFSTEAQQSQLHRLSTSSCEEHGLSLEGGRECYSETTDLEKILPWIKDQRSSSQKHILEECMLKSLRGAYRPGLINVNRRNQLSLNEVQTTSDCLI
ncbi:hypothetical protein LEMLEM_LOCUS14142 [Lemmus lemmus]